MTTKKFVVSDEQKIAFGDRVWDLERRFRGGSVNPIHILDGIPVLSEGKKIIIDPHAKDWMEAILARNLQCLTEFGVTGFDQSQSLFRATLERIGEKLVDKWQSMLLVPFYCPTISLGPDDNYPGFKKKPVWLYEKAKEGKIFRLSNGELVKVEKPWIIPGGVYLADTRCKPSYQDGKQMWDNDKKFLGWMIEKLRKNGKLARHDWCHSDSRFGMSALEVEQYLWPMLHGHPNYRMAMEIRSENTSEANFISQCFSFMPRFLKDGDTNTSVWFADSFEDRDRRLCGGNSALGGLSFVYWHGAGSYWTIRSVRPLAVLALEN